jgi:hypothetical protein
MEAVEGGSAYAGIELNSWKQSGPSLEFSNTVYENGTETLESTLGDKPANLGQSYKVSVVKGESAYQLFLNSELIGEYPVRGELLYFVFGGYHDEYLPWDGYIDNVRVLRRSSGSPSIKVAPLALSAFRDKVSLQGKTDQSK